MFQLVKLLRKLYAMFQLRVAYSAAVSCSYLIFFIIFLGSTNNISTSTASTLNCYDEYAATRYVVNCSSGSSGPSGPVMEYPFWKIDYQQQQPQRYYCGYPGLGITCRPNVKPPIINISNQSYYVIGSGSRVLGISSDDRRLTIVNPDFVDITCPRPRRNFTFNHDFSDSAIERVTSSIKELTLFLNCTSPPPSPPPPPPPGPPLLAPPGPPPSSDVTTYYGINRSHQIRCLDYNDTISSYAFFSGELDYTTDTMTLDDWNRNYCKEKLIVQVSVSDSEINGYIEALQRGFGVMWRTPIECQRCEESGGFCSFTTYGKPISYNCWCKDESQLRYGADGREYCLSNGLAAALRKKVRKKVLIGVFSGVGGLMFITLLFVYCKIQRKRRRSIAQKVELFLESYGCRSSQRYKYTDIKKMTNSFKDKLGEGGYGSVFKGKLVDGRPVAVKILNNDPKKNTNGEDFMNEVATIGSTNHVNIVALIGFCSSGSNRAIVYEFMPNGSLEKFIYAKKEKSTTTECTSDHTATTPSASSNEVVFSLGWEKLYQIALGIARGLEYLHRGCNTGRILHFDIKPHNILLDENFCPKISDFGLAKLCTTRESIVSMLSGGRGTLGYIAPEVYNRNFGGVSYKSDVYSYGMMVLEMVGGRKNIDPFVENTSEIYFPHWIYNHLEKDKDKIEGLLKFEEALDEEMAKKMIMVGLWCIQTHQESRPSMGRVAEMLEGNIKDLQMPPNPFVDPSLHHQPPTS